MSFGVSPVNFFFPGQDQYYSRLFLWVCCSGSTRRLNREVDFCCFWRSPGSNLQPLVYKASDLTTAPRRLLVNYSDSDGGLEFELCNFLKCIIIGVVKVFNSHNNIMKFSLKMCMQFFLITNV